MPVVRGEDQPAIKGGGDLGGCLQAPPEPARDRVWKWAGRREPFPQEPLRAFGRSEHAARDVHRDSFELQGRGAGVPVLLGRKRERSRLVEGQQEVVLEDLEAAAIFSREGLARPGHANRLHAVVRARQAQHQLIGHPIRAAKLVDHSTSQPRRTRGVSDRQDRSCRDIGPWLIQGVVVEIAIEDRGEPANIDVLGFVKAEDDSSLGRQGDTIKAKVARDRPPQDAQDTVNEVRPIRHGVEVENAAIEVPPRPSP